MNPLAVPQGIGQDSLDFSQRDAVQCAPRKKLMIELDGSQHLEQKEYDNERTKYLESRGYRVIRFWKYISSIAQ